MTEPSGNETESQLSKEEVDTLADYPGCMARFPSIGTFEQGKVTVVELEAAQNVGGSLIIALPGVGATSTVVGAYLIKHLNLPLVALVDSESFPPMCSIHSWNATSPMRIYGSNTICVIVSDHQVDVAKQPKLVYDITHACVGFATRHGLNSVIGVTGHPVESDGTRAIEKMQRFVVQAQRGRIAPEEKEEERDPNAPDPFKQIHFVTTDPEMGAKLLEKEHKPIKTGALVGFVGSLLSWSYTGMNGDEAIPHATALLAPDPMKLPDQRGALEVVKFLKIVFELEELDLSELESEAQRLLDKIKQTVDQVYEQLKQQLGPAARNLPPPPGMYL